MTVNPGPRQDDSQNKVLVIGLDGATFDLITPWVADGKLPTLGRLISEGAHGVLESVPNMCSAAAWASFATGKNPGKHGVYWFAEPRDDSYAFRYTNATHCHAAPIWRTLSDLGKKVGVINVPITYPAEQVASFLIAGLDAPGVDSRGFTYPPDLVDEIMSVCSDYTITVGLRAYEESGRLDEGLERLATQMEARFRVARHLMRTRPWDLFVVIFTATDYAQHALWKYCDPSHPLYQEEEGKKYGGAIYDVYQQLDRYIAALLDDVEDDTTVFIVSDHGAGINQTGASHLNSWLEEQGWLRFQSSRTFTGMLDLPNSLRSAFMALLGQVYSFLRLTLRREQLMVLSRRFPGLRSRVETTLHYSQIDWANTRAYSDGATDCIRINLAGREPQGIVQPGAEYDALCDLIVQRLRECRDPVTGSRVAEQVYRREGVYHGPYVNRAADIEIRWQRDGIIHRLTSSSETSTHRFKTMVDQVSGGHRPNGILIARGKNVASGVVVQGAELVDMAPTILCALGQGIPYDMDGKVLSQIFTQPFLEATPIHSVEPIPDFPGPGDHSDGYSESEAEEIETRLKGLGYID